MDEDEREYQAARKRVLKWFCAQVIVAGAPVKIGERRKRSFGELPPPPIPDPVILHKPTTRTEMPRP